MEQITLNMIPKGITPMCHASQYDKGRHIRLNIMDGLQGYKLTDETAEIRVRKPDNNIVTAAGTYTAGTAYVDLFTTEQMTACDGDNECELRLTRGEQRIGSLNFKMRVEKDPLKDGIESESVIHNLEKQIEELVEEQYDADSVIFDDEPTEGHGTGFAVTSEGVKTYVEGEIAALTIPEELDDLQDVELTSPTAGQILEYDDNDGKWKNVANPASTTNFGAPYDENTTYNVPSLVIENNLLYKLNEGEVDVTGPFDPTKWTQTSVAELAALIGSLSSLTTTDKSSLVGAVNEVDGKIKTYNWTGTNVTITTLYSGGSMYYCDITFPSGEATDSNEILALTMVDYGGLSNVLQFQIRGARAFRIWSKTSMTLSTLTVKVLYSR